MTRAEAETPRVGEAPASAPASAPSPARTEGAEGAEGKVGDNTSKNRAESPSECANKYPAEGPAINASKNAAHSAPASVTGPRGRAVRRPQAATLKGLLGGLPFFAFMAVFLVLPIVANTVTALQAPSGGFSLESMAQVLSPTYLPAFALTAQLSLVTALIGGVFGLLLAWALTHAKRPKWLRGAVNSFSALASQAGGVQLGFAFIAMLGTQGLLSDAIERVIPHFSDAFSITSFWGITLVYLYFQVPLMAILMLPALGGLRTAWREAAETLGASRTQFLRDVALPVLWPSLLGSLLLLFANAFAAYATAYAIAGGSLNLVSIVIGYLISGNVMLNPNLAAAMVTWMMLIILAALGARFLLTKRSERWLSQR